MGRLSTSSTAICLNLTSYHAAQNGVAWADRSERVRLEVGGRDRGQVLAQSHDQRGQETAAGPWLRNIRDQLAREILAPRQSACLLRLHPRLRRPGAAWCWRCPHFQKYGVFDEITLDDRSESTFEFHLAGPNSEELVRRAAGELARSRRFSLTEPRPWQGGRVLIVRESPTGPPGLDRDRTQRAPPAAVSESLRSSGQDLGLVEMDLECFEGMRIEAGTPVFGREVTEKNLPQEIGRDDRAINFVKGCYLDAQETVRPHRRAGTRQPDPHGTANRALPRAALPPGSALLADGKRVGTVTSSAFSPGWNSTIALSMIRVTHSRTGTELGLNVSDPTGDPMATVCALPMIPNAPTHSA